MVNSELDRFVWSKSEPRKSLECHLYEAAIVIKILLTNSVFSNLLPDLAEWLGISEEDTVCLAQYLAGTHDEGKAFPYFAFNKLVGFVQVFLEKHPELSVWIPENMYRHERGSAEIVKRIWKREGLFDTDLRICFSQILQLHHQGKKGGYVVPDLTSAYPDWVQVQDTIEKRIRDRFTPPVMCFDQLKHVDAACTTMTALLILTDWIASSSPFAGNAEPIPEDALTEQIRAFLQKIGLDKCPSVTGESMTDFWSWMTEDSLRPLQKAMENKFRKQDEMPFLTILEAPMGEGKTEAGLFAAVKMARFWRKTGVYVALPTAATSNQMYDRVNAFLQEHGIPGARLMHGMAWLKEDDDRELRQSEGSDSSDGLENWLKPGKRALLSPWAVGTVDQALMAVLHIKYGVLRLLGLANKVLVIDEVHAYDAYMSDILVRLLEWCRVLRIPVVMLSATLPAEKKSAFLEVYREPGKKTELTEGYPLITSVYPDGRIEQIPVQGSEQRNRVEVSCLTCSPDDNMPVVELALEKTRNGGCLCLLANTVGRAQEIYRLLKNSGTDCPIMLFHSRFSAARREEIETECLRLFGKDHTDRPRRVILVATQVVEQSLDLDFDTMITELAPIDLLLQRLGRLYRHKNTVRPEALRKPSVTVLVPKGCDFGASGAIYYELFLKRTRDILARHPVISIPEDIPKLVNQVYSEVILNENEAEIFYRQQYGDKFKSAQAGTYELKPPDPEDFLLSQTGSPFLDDEDSWVAAKTRLGEDSVRIAFLPPSLYALVNERMKAAERIGSDLARRVMRYSVSIRQKTWDKITGNCASDTPFINGEGKLFGVRMLRAENEGEPNMTLTASICGNRLVLDRELGFLAE